MWLSGRASERENRRSEVSFLMGTQNFFFVPRSWQDEKTPSSIFLPCSKLTIFLILSRSYLWWKVRTSVVLQHRTFESYLEVSDRIFLRELWFFSSLQTCCPSPLAEYSPIKPKPKSNSLYIDNESDIPSRTYLIKNSHEAHKRSNVLLFSCNRFYSRFDAFQEGIKVI